MQSFLTHGLPPGLNGDPRGSSPGKPGRGVATRLVNLDCNDKLVKKGRIVTWHGFRYRVDRVNRGVAYITQLDAFGKPKESGLSWLECHRLTVVA